MIGAQPFEILYGGGIALSCGFNGELHSEELHGLFAADTRVLSSYRLTIAGHAWRLLSRTRPSSSSAQWDMQNPRVRAPGAELEEGLIHCRLRRQVLGALHDCIVVTSFADKPLALRLSLLLDADFMDIFQVKDGSLPPRLGVARASSADSISFAYERRDFRRGLHISFSSSAGSPVFVGTQAVFDLVLEPRQPWRLCLDAMAEIDGRKLAYQGNPHASQPAPATDVKLQLTAEALLAAPFLRGRSDLERLAMSHQGGESFIAAGAPWFLALFGRDVLVTSLMTGLLGARQMRGALLATAKTQARATDDARDAGPGKLAHELRVGELAHFHAIPHTPYYGTHDAPALFVLALWNAFRWTGDRSLLERFVPTAHAALDWCQQLGDEDGDGLLEYRTRSNDGYRNQSWKDAHDAIPHEDGTQAELPIATVELQGYWYAARLAMAELLDAAGEPEHAQHFRHHARELRNLVERRFWMDDKGYYALALDGKKRLVSSVASNQGHLLWCGLPSRERAARVARRLLADDMFSGYGLRTLSAEHCKYNPLSYQLGSVWPHDSALLAAGLARYGLRREAAILLRGLLDAASAFEQGRLPELFCGFERGEGAPIPYEKANVPQAWAAAVPVLAAQVFLGLLPDAPNNRCYVAPWLPDWLPALTLRGIEIGTGRLDIKVTRNGSETRVDYAEHPALEIIAKPNHAPLWGLPSETIDGQTMPQSLTQPASAGERQLHGAHPTAGSLTISHGLGRR
jgi:glycogen debranching enzyme